MKFNKIATSLVTMAMASATSLAAPPELITYQGRLLENGVLASRQISLVIKLYDAPHDGSMLYADSNVVTVVDGFYSTLIGDNTVYGSLTEALMNDAVFTEIVIDGVALKPRERLVSVAYAINTSKGAKGETGATGPQGPQGATGPQGPAVTNTITSYGFLGMSMAVTQQLITTHGVVTNFHVSLVSGPGISANKANGVLTLPAGTYDVCVQLSATSGNDFDYAVIAVDGAEINWLGTYCAEKNSSGSASFSGPLTLTNASQQLSLLIMQAKSKKTVSLRQAQIWVKRLF